MQQQASRGKSCPACAGKVFIKDKSLAFLFPKIAREWHPVRNGEKSPDNVHARTKMKYWFMCRKYGGKWQARINLRIRGMGAYPCSYLAATNLRKNIATTYGIMPILNNVSLRRKYF